MQKHKRKRKKKKEMKGAKVEKYVKRVSKTRAKRE